MERQYLKSQDYLFDSPEKAQTLYEYLLDFYGEERASSFLEFYQRSEEFSLEDKVNELKALVLPSEKTDPRIFRARELTAQLLEGRVGEIIREIEGIPLIYGSIEFGDPRNLDLDMIVLSFAELDFRRKVELDREITNSFIEAWEWEGEPHPRIVTLKEIDEYLSLLNPENIDHFVYDTVYGGTYPDLDVLLSGEALVDDERFEPFQEELSMIVSGNKILKAMVASHIQEAIDVRIERRKDSSTSLIVL